MPLSPADMFAAMARRLDTVRRVQTLRRRVAKWREEGQTIGLVPTMGALHEGHLSLVKLSLKKTDKTIVTIFVNPTQFAPGEDLDRYPRNETSDRAQLSKLGIDLIYAPSPDEMYPQDFSTLVHVGGLGEGLCGVSRPHFFGGVATVVSKLLLQALPDIAIFGQKDYQQLLVIKRMVRDLNIPVSIVGGPTVREKDGLALSSRNQYLTKEQRVTAPILYRTIKDVATDIGNGRVVEDALASAKARLEGSGFDLDYLQVCSAYDLTPLEEDVTEQARVFIAANLGKTRLIDNVAVPPRKKQTKPTKWMLY